MHAQRMMIAGLSAISLAGCAGPGAFQEIRRLRADVGLLDQRVTQLERMSVRGSVSSAWSDAQPQATLSTAPAHPSATPAVKPVATPAPQHSKRDIQQALKNAGFYQEPIDGKIGPQTREAIKQFQQANGLKVDGVVGRHTWEKLAPYLNLAVGAGEAEKPQPTK